MNFIIKNADYRVSVLIEMKGGNMMVRRKKQLQNTRFLIGDAQNHRIIHMDYTTELKKLLKQFKEVSHQKNKGAIDVGSKFTIVMDFEGELETMTLNLVEFEADIKNDEISRKSPLGQALIGKSIGDDFSYHVGDEKITGRVNDIITKDKVKEFKHKV